MNNLSLETLKNLNSKSNSLNEQLEIISNTLDEFEINAENTSKITERIKNAFSLYKDLVEEYQRKL